MSTSVARPARRPPMVFSIVWLIYMAYPVQTLLQRPTGEMIAGLALSAVFIFMYVYSFRNIRGRFELTLAQMAIITYFVFRYDINFFYMCFYPAPIIGMMPSIRKTAVSYAFLAALLVFTLTYYWSGLQESDVIQVLVAVFLVLVMPVAFRLGRRAVELREKLDLANEEIARLSKNEERQRISRDLHDTLGHTLSLITLKSELAEKLIAKNPERAAQEVRDIQATSRAALRQVRELVSGMNTATVEDEITHAKQILAAANIKLEVRGRFGEPAVQPIVDNILGMCLRESVTNVVKHSRASACVVERGEEGSTLMLAVSDNGRGMNAKQIEALTGGSGLKGMRERLKLVEGEVRFESGADEGTRVVFAVPRVSRSASS
ncbi:sensor histidine kinase [Paenibacillus humicola]|uniref:sensor histidine kinase n=1 Tax=Paenibacillus humicola TaxID=3110540 RepID=UPI00237ABFE9|nr:sensor histidine kinase [Paenibacillus humicola]